MVNGVDITEERAEKYSFSDPYAYNRTAVIVNSANDEIQSMEDLDGKSTANTISSTYAEVAEKYGAAVTGVDDLEQTFELLLSGRIDATLNAEVTYYDYMKAHPDAEIKIACLDPESTKVGIPMKKGDETKTCLLYTSCLAESAETMLIENAPVVRKKIRRQARFLIKFFKYINPIEILGKKVYNRRRKSIIWNVPVRAS